MNKSDSKIGFLQAEIAALEELLENTPRDHFLMREPLKDRKRELTTRLESLLFGMKAPAMVEKPPLIGADKIEVSEISKVFQKSR